MVYGDVYFEKINRNSQMNRKTFINAKQNINSIDVIKYVKFQVKERYSCKEIYELYLMIKDKNKVLLTFYNPRKNECCFIFVGSDEDYELEDFLERFLEMENY